MSQLCFLYYNFGTLRNMLNIGTLGIISTFYRFVHNEIKCMASMILIYCNEKENVKYDKGKYNVAGK